MTNSTAGDLTADGIPKDFAGLSLSTVLLLFYFNPWYLFILAVNVALIVGITGLDWPAESTVGA